MKLRRMRCPTCGRFFYWKRAFHRPTTYDRSECFTRERNRRRRLRARFS